MKNKKNLGNAIHPTVGKTEPLFEGAEFIDGVKKSFDGLNKTVAKLPEGKDKFAITNWVADTYLAVSKTILSITGGANFATGNAATVGA